MHIIDTSAQDRADMARLAEGHEAALNDLMARHGTSLFQFLYRMLGHEDDANDLAQEAFVRVYQHRDRFRPDSKFTTWLYTIAGNLARNHYRWRSRHPAVSLETEAGDGPQTLGDTLVSPQAGPDEAAAAGERAAVVRAAVDALPEEMREAIILCEWEDLPGAEAATVLNTTPKAVESRLYRARNLLREKLRKWL